MVFVCIFLIMLQLVNSKPYCPSDEDREKASYNGVCDKFILLCCYDEVFDTNLTKCCYTYTSNGTSKCCGSKFDPLINLAFIPSGLFCFILWLIFATYKIYDFIISRLPKHFGNRETGEELKEISINYSSDIIYT
jgi:hypothetical protein